MKMNNTWFLLEVSFRLVVEILAKITYWFRPLVIWDAYEPFLLPRISLVQKYVVRHHIFLYIFHNHPKLKLVFFLLLSFSLHCLCTCLYSLLEWTSLGTTESVPQCKCSINLFNEMEWREYWRSTDKGVTNLSWRDKESLSRGYQSRNLKEELKYPE